MTISKLYKAIIDRRENMPENSYTTSLFKEGSDRIIQKVGEEAVEVVIAAKGASKERLQSELADLVYHCLVLMAEKDIKPEDIIKELDKRQKDATIK